MTFKGEEENSNLGCIVVPLTLIILGLYGAFLFIRGKSWETIKSEDVLIGEILTTEMKIFYQEGNSEPQYNRKRVKEIDRVLECTDMYKHMFEKSYSVDNNTSFEVVEILEIGGRGLLQNYNYTVAVLKDDLGKLSTRSIKTIDFQRNDVCIDD